MRRRQTVFSNFSPQLFPEVLQPNNFEEIEIDTDRLYLALAQNNTPDCIKQNVVKVWAFIRSKECTDQIKTHSFGNFSPRNCCFIHAQFHKREPGLLKESLELPK